MALTLEQKKELRRVAARVEDGVSMMLDDEYFDFIRKFPDIDIPKSFEYAMKELIRLLKVMK